jgi:hypothetical protein
MQASDALNATLLLASVGLIVSACEHFAIIREFRPTGIYSSLLHIESRVYRATSKTQIQDMVYSPAALAVCLGIQIILACIVIFFSASRSVHLHPVILWLLTAATAFISWRRKIGGDGAQQMTMLILTASSIGCGFQRSIGCCRAAVIFIAAQACLSYFVAGTAKAISARWRSGQALENVLNTNTFGSIWMSSVLRRSPLLSRCLNWSVIIGELLFSSVIFAPRFIRASILSAGVGFHGANAMLMGLNDFFWAFVATYPCIYWVASQITSTAT